MSSSLPYFHFLSFFPSFFLSLFLSFFLSLFPSFFLSFLLSLFPSPLLPFLLSLFFFSEAGDLRQEGSVINQEPRLLEIPGQGSGEEEIRNRHPGIAIRNQGTRDYHLRTIGGPIQEHLKMSGDLAERKKSGIAIHGMPFETREPGTTI